jgi:hypothetical protein
MIWILKILLILFIAFCLLWVWKFIDAFARFIDNKD